MSNVEPNEHQTPTSEDNNLASRGNSPRQRNILKTSWTIIGSIATLFVLFNIVVRCSDIEVNLGSVAVIDKSPAQDSGMPTAADTDQELPGSSVTVPPELEDERKTLTPQITEPPDATTSAPVTQAPADSEPETTVPTPSDETTPTPATSPPGTDPTVAAVRQDNDYYAFPELFDLDQHESDGEYSWWRPSSEVAHAGYSGSGFWFTLAYGGSDTIDNFARWEFVVAAGDYDLQAFIPSRWATAEIQYLIWNDENGDGKFSEEENLDSPWVDQARVEGHDPDDRWVSLGEYSLDGTVRVEVHDTRSRDDWRVDGTVNSRLAVDVMRLVSLPRR